jgi:hypothetical protein
MPALLLLCFGILEFSLVIFDFHRAGEATRRGARLAAISTPVADLDGFSAGTAIGCSSVGGGVSCGGAEAADPALFTAVVAEMRAVLPAIAAENVEIVYRDSGLGDAATPGGIIPLVTIRLVGLDHPFLLLSALPGMMGRQAEDFGVCLNVPLFSPFIGYFPCRGRR